MEAGSRRSPTTGSTSNSRILLEGRTSALTRCPRSARSRATCQPRKPEAPVTTVVPSMGLILTADQLRLAAIRNGFALRDADGEALFGAQPFGVDWSGTLLVEEPGRYEFAAGSLTAEEEEPG